MLLELDGIVRMTCCLDLASPLETIQRVRSPPRVEEGNVYQDKKKKKCSSCHYYL